MIRVILAEVDYQHVIENSRISKSSRWPAVYVNVRLVLDYQTFSVHEKTQSGYPGISGDF